MDVHQVHVEPEHGVLDVVHSRAHDVLMGLRALRLLEVVLADLVRPGVLHHALFVHGYVEEGLQALEHAEIHFKLFYVFLVIHMNLRSKTKLTMNTEGRLSSIAIELYLFN